MVRTATVQVFTFNELSSKAKERARDWYRAGMEQHEYAESVIEDAVEIGRGLGFTMGERAYKTVGGSTMHEPRIFWSGFSSQGDGACFEACWGASDVKPGAVAEYAPVDTDLAEIAAEFEAVAAQFPDASFRVKQTGHYQHSGCTEFDFDFGHGDDIADEGPRDVEIAAEERLTGASRAFMDWIYAQLRAEYEYQTDDAQVDEAIIANDYEFTETGARWTD